VLYVFSILISVQFSVQNNLEKQTLQILNQNSFSTNKGPLFQSGSGRLVVYQADSMTLREPKKKTPKKSVIPSHSVRDPQKSSKRIRPFRNSESTRISQETPHPQKGPRIANDSSSMPMLKSNSGVQNVHRYLWSES
jgi:hypothetical protein